MKHQEMCFYGSNLLTFAAVLLSQRTDFMA